MGRAVNARAMHAARALTLCGGVRRWHGARARRRARRHLEQPASSATVSSTAAARGRRPSTRPAGGRSTSTRRRRAAAGPRANASDERGRCATSRSAMRAPARRPRRTSFEVGAARDGAAIAADAARYGEGLRLARFDHLSRERDARATWGIVGRRARRAMLRPRGFPWRARSDQRRRVQRAVLRRRSRAGGDGRRTDRIVSAWGGTARLARGWVRTRSPARARTITAARARRSTATGRA